MKASELTLQQIERTINKVADKFPPTDDPMLMTDIHFRVNQETGEFVAFDDDDKEITRSVIEQWINNKDDNFYNSIAPVIHKCLENRKDIIEQMPILKPYSFVLENEDKDAVAELYIVDDDTVIISPELMAGLDKDLDDFIDKLLSKN